jgi:hypothetical protein
MKDPADRSGLPRTVFLHVRRGKAGNVAPEHVVRVEQLLRRLHAGLVVAPQLAHVRLLSHGHGVTLVDGNRHGGGRRDVLSRARGSVRGGACRSGGVDGLRSFQGDGGVGLGVHSGAACVAQEQGQGAHQM